ncbi:MAG: TonB-dependent receptor, partial [Gammaproteobacteria bacterium]
MNRMQGRIAWVTSGLWALAAGPATAGTQLPDQIVTAERTAGLHVLEGAELARLSGISVADWLRHLPGVFIDRSGARGGVSSLYLRGADPNFTAIFIDGVKVNDPTNTRGGSYDLATLALADIERIELLSGPSSAMLGADALAGAINIVTRRAAAEQGASLAVGAGSFGYGHARAGVEQRRPGWAYALRGGFLDSGDAVEGSSSTIATGTAHVDLGKDLAASLHYSDAELSSFPDDSGGPRYATRRALEDRHARELLSGIGYRFGSGSAWHTHAHASLFRRTEHVDSPGVAPGQRDLFGIPAGQVDNDLRRYELRLAAQWRAGEPLSAGIGVHAAQETGESRGELQLLGPVDFDLNRHFVAGTLQAAYRSALGVGLAGSVRV